MKKAVKETRSQIEERRYIAVRNAYSDPKLARKARGWSDDRIEKELGVRIPKTASKLRALPSQATRDKKQRLLENYRFGVQEVKLDPRESYKVKAYSHKKIYATKEYIDAEKSAKKTIKREFMDLNRRERLDLWTKWAKEKAFPPALRALVKRVNESSVAGIEPNTRKLDPMDDYGFGYVFYEFVEQYSDEEIEDTMAPDKYEIGRIRYKSTGRM